MEEELEGEAGGQEISLEVRVAVPQKVREESRPHCVSKTNTYSRAELP